MIFGDLHGWKEIASYAGRSVSWCKYWSKLDPPLPIHYHATPLNRQPRVYAFRSEIDRWALSLASQNRANAAKGSQSGKRRRKVLA